MDVTNSFLVAPGHCFTCGTSQAKAIIDTGADHPGMVRRFRIYLCDTCITAASKMIAPMTGKRLVDEDAFAELENRADNAAMWRTRAEVAESRLAEVAAYVKADA